MSVANQGSTELALWRYLQYIHSYMCVDIAVRLAT